MSNLILPRRKFLIGLGALIAAPAIARASSLMPVKVMVPSGPLRVYVDPVPLVGVANNGPRRFHSISDAIEFVQAMGSPESEIILASGTYNETVNLPIGGDHTLIAEMGSHVDMRDCHVSGGNKSAPMICARTNAVLVDLRGGKVETQTLAASWGGVVIQP
jgi:pectin methylesterase-like acyl-CoA thioesterase